MTKDSKFTAKDAQRAMAHEMRGTRLGKGFAATTTKSGKVKVEAKPAPTSVSRKIAQSKSKKTKVVRRTPKSPVDRGN